MKKFLFWTIFTLAAAALVNAAQSPEQQARDFVFSLHDNGDVGPALKGLFKESPTYAAHPEHAQETETAISRLLQEFGPIRFSRFLKRDDIAPVLTRLTLVSDTIKGPIFWGIIFYRNDPKVDDWLIVSIKASGSAEDILK